MTESVKDRVVNLSNSIIDWVQSSLLFIGVASIVLMSFAATLQIGMRFVPSDFVTFSTEWTTELIRYLMVIMAVSGVPYAMKTDSHISIRPLIERLSEKWYQFMIIVSNVLIILMSLVVMVSGFVAASRTVDQQLVTINWLTIGYAHSFMSVMFLITALYATIQILETDYFPGIERHQEPDSENKSTVGGNHE